MTRWNHRVVQFVRDNGARDHVAMCEVFYKQGEPVSYAEADLTTDSVSDLRTQLARFQTATTEPVLTFCLDTETFIPTLEETFP